MNNLNLGTFIHFGSIPRKLSQDDPNNRSGNCPTKIIKRLPIWINNQPYWTYQCKCCKIYQFEKGKTNSEWGGLYE